MSDRNAKLSIETDASSMGKAAEDAKKLTTAIEKVGDAGADASADLKKTADSLEKVETAETGVTDASQQAAGALQDVGAVAAESSQTAAEGASVAAQAVDGVTQAAGEEREALLASGAAAVESGAETTAALDEVTDAVQEATDETVDLGKATEQAAEEAQGFKEGVKQIEAMTESIRKSGLALEVQRQGIAAIITEVEKLVSEEIQRGEAGLENSNVAGQALVGLRAHLADVNAEIKKEVESLRGMGNAGSEALAEINTGLAGFDAAANAAFSDALAITEKLNTEFKITPKSIADLAQKVEVAGIAIVEAGERGIAVTVEQLGIYERLQAELGNLTAKANQLTNAAKDNAIGLKQTGAQLAGVTNGVQQLTSMLGPNASKIGMVVGNVGQLGGVMESLQAQVKSLDLNTLSLAGSSTKLGVQVAAVVAVLTAAATAGVKLAETNAQNAESTRDLWEWMKRLGSGEIDRVIGQLSGLQTGFQDLRNASVDLSAKDLAHSLAEIAIASGRGADGVKLYNVALRDGLTAQQAMRLSAGATAEVLKFYEDSAKGGAEGHQIWLRALRESEGDAQKMAAFIAANNAQLQKSIAITTAHTEAQKKNNAATREGINLAALKADTTTRLLSAEEQNVARLSAANRQLEQAQNGTTASLNQGLAAIRSMIGDSARNSEELSDMAGALSEVLANVTNLSAKERERHATIIELALRGNELTVSEREYAAALAQSIINGDRTVVSMQERMELAALLKTAVDDLVTATNAEASAHDSNETAIERAVKAAEKLLASNAPLEATERLRLSTIVELGKQVGELAAQQDRLTAAAAQGAEAEAAVGDAESSLILVKSGKVDVIQREIDAKAEMIKALSIEKTSTEELTTATQAIIKVQEDGRTVYTNLAEDQRKAADATKAGGDAAEKAAGQFGDVLIRRLADGRIVIANVGETAGETADNIARVGHRAAESGPAVATAFQSWKDSSGNLDSVLDKMRELEALFASLEERPLRIAQNVAVMGKALEAAGDSATKASGYASGKVQETG